MTNQTKYELVVDDFSTGVFFDSLKVAREYADTYLSLRDVVIEKIKSTEHGPVLLKRYEHSRLSEFVKDPQKGGAERGKVKERFGERIRRLRTEQKLGLREFALKVGISPTYLSRIETSKEKAPPAEDVIRKMASQLGDSFDQLMTHAGRVSEASLDVIKADSKMPEFLRTVRERKLSAEDIMKLLPSEPKNGDGYGGG